MSKYERTLIDLLTEIDEEEEALSGMPFDDLVSLLNTAINRKNMDFVVDEGVLLEVLEDHFILGVDDDGILY